MNGNNERDDKLTAELRELLIEAGAEPRDLTPLPGQSERAEGLLATIVQTSPTHETPVVHVQFNRKRRAAQRAVGLLAAAAVVAIATVVVWPGQGTAPADASTPAMLHFQDVKRGTLPAAGEPARDELMTLASKAKALPDSAGPIQHIVVDAWWASTDDPADGSPASTVIEPVRRESFFQPDATIRAIEVRGAPMDDEGHIVAGGSDKPISDESFESPDPGPGYADSLPTVPAELQVTLEANHDPVSCEAAAGSCFMADVVDLNANYVLPPKLTAALWDVLAEEPSITSLGTTEDRLGRTALAFSTPGQDGTSQQLLLIDPKTGAYLGEEVILTVKSETYSFTPPAVISFSALVRAERIDEDQLPPPP